MVWIRHARRGLAFPETAIGISLRDHPSTSRRASWYYNGDNIRLFGNIKWSRCLRTRNAFGIEFASDGAGRLACGEEAAKILRTMAASASSITVPHYRRKAWAVTLYPLANRSWVYSRKPSHQKPNGPIGNVAVVKLYDRPTTS